MHADGMKEPGCIICAVDTGTGCAMNCLRFRDSPEAEIKCQCMRKKCIYPLLKAMVRSKENAGTAARFAGTGPRNVSGTKGTCMVKGQARVKGQY